MKMFRSSANETGYTKFANPFADTSQIQRKQEHRRSKSPEVNKASIIGRKIENTGELTINNEEIIHRIRLLLLL